MCAVWEKRKIGGNKNTGEGKGTGGGGKKSSLPAVFHKRLSTNRRTYDQIRKNRPPHRLKKESSGNEKKGDAAGNRPEVALTHEWKRLYLSDSWKKNFPSLQAKNKGKMARSRRGLPKRSRCEGAFRCSCYKKGPPHFHSKKGKERTLALGERGEVTLL